MRRIILVFALILAFVSCDKKTKVEEAVEKKPVELKVSRFDKLFFETSPEDLSKLKNELAFG
jgi:hypothetical protein